MIFPSQAAKGNSAVWNSVVNFTRNKRDMDTVSKVDRVQIETGFKDAQDALRPKRAPSLC